MLLIYNTVTCFKENKMNQSHSKMTYCKKKKKEKLFWHWDHLQIHEVERGLEYFLEISMVFHNYYFTITPKLPEVIEPACRWMYDYWQSNITAIIFFCFISQLAKVKAAFGIVLALLQYKQIFVLLYVLYLTI